MRAPVTNLRVLLSVLTFALEKVTLETLKSVLLDRDFIFQESKYRS